MSLVNVNIRVRRWYIQKNVVKKFRGNAFNAPPGMAFCIRNFDFDNFQNPVQISFKSYLKNWKNFPTNYNVSFQIPPSYAILESKNRLHRISIFAPDFVQICPEKLMKNFNRLKCIMQTWPAVVCVYFGVVALWFALYGGFIVSV